MAEVTLVTFTGGIARRLHIRDGDVIIIRIPGNPSGEELSDVANYFARLKDALDLNNVVFIVGRPDLVVEQFDEVEMGRLGWVRSGVSSRHG